MTSNEYERISFEREVLKDKYEDIIHNKKYVYDIKSNYDSEMKKVHEKIKKDNVIKRFFRKLFHVL